MLVLWFSLPICYAYNTQLPPEIESYYKSFNFIVLWSTEEERFYLSQLVDDDGASTLVPFLSKRYQALIKAHHIIQSSMCTKSSHTFSEGSHEIISKKILILTSSLISLKIEMGIVHSDIIQTNISQFSMLPYISEPHIQRKVGEQNNLIHEWKLINGHWILNIS